MNHNIREMGKTDLELYPCASSPDALSAIAKARHLDGRLL
jgi:hypothetical protein